MQSKDALYTYIFPAEMYVSVTSLQLEKKSDLFKLYLQISHNLKYILSIHEE